MIEYSILYKTIEIEFKKKWTSSPNHFPESKRRFSYFEKRIWEIKFNHYLKAIEKEFKHQKPDKTKLLKQSKMFFEENLAYPQEQLSMIFSGEMLNATKDFIRKAWEFDKQLNHKEIFQALRNLWVMLGLQSFFGKEIKITDSLLAYSLLYPYTDNLIDSPIIAKTEKLNFCERFQHRLNGKPIKAKSQIESRIYDLVTLIESEFDRESHPDLYASLLAIHKAQTQSLKLVNTDIELSENERFNICIQKGATSVIADGFLVMGHLNEKQYHFLYQYGAYLQMLDDLQDARDDYEDGVMTYFSHNLSQTKLDHLLCKTYYMGKSFYTSIEEWYPNEISFKSLIERSFNFLLLASVYQNQKDYSKDFVTKIEKHIPFRFSFLQKKKTKLKPLQEKLLVKVNAYKSKEFAL